MEVLVALMTYVFDTFKFAFISYFVIGMTPAKGKKRYVLLPILIGLGVVTYLRGEFSFLGNMVLIFSLTFFWFHEKMRLSILTIIIEWVTVSFLDLMMWLMCVSMTPLGNQFESHMTLIEIVANISGLVPVLLVGFLMKRKNKVLRERLKEVHIIRYTLVILIIIAMCIVSACMQGMVLGEITYETRRLVMIACIVLSFFVVSLCILYINVVDSKKQLAEINALNEKCIEYQKNYYTNIMKKDEQLRSFKHDVNKHIASLKVLCSEKKYEEIEEYLGAIGGESKTEYIYKTGNLIADYIINAVVREVTEQVPLSVKIVGKFPRDMKLGNTEVCIVLANILDNAKEAILEYQGDRVLEMDIRNYRERLFITLKNSSPKREYEYGVSTKKDKENHGYGMKNVHKIIEKYDGNIEMSWRKNVFITEIEI